MDEMKKIFLGLFFVGLISNNLIVKSNLRTPHYEKEIKMLGESLGIDDTKIIYQRKELKKTRKEHYFWILRRFRWLK